MSQSFEFNTASNDKIEVFQQAARILIAQQFKLIDLDIVRPWGFYISVDEGQAQKFIEEFYSGVKFDALDESLPLRPKFLGIAPGQRLSWQFHHRRSEIWRSIAGEFSLITSSNDDESDPKAVKSGDVVHIPQGQRHCGVGGKNWSLIAEIWQHVDASSPSTEEDIVRLQDDFGRK